MVGSAVVERAKLCLLDCLGCGLFGSTLPWTTMLADVMVEVEGRGPAWALGAKAPLPVPVAALVSGSAIHAFELDDLHQRSILHPGSVVVSSLLSLAQAQPLSGRDFLAAMAGRMNIA